MKLAGIGGCRMANAGALTESNLRETFSAWIDPLSTHTPPVVLVGAGLSYGLVPTADEYGQEIGKRCREIEAKLGVAAITAPIDAATLYQWAGECIDGLKAKGVVESKAKLDLAREMGLTTDARFLSKANIPSRGTTPRHRVLSRLAREGRVASFWSFNWDRWLETSLESVGLRRGERASAVLAAPPEWRLRYMVWFSGANFSIRVETVPIFKAHGCVQALFESKGEFVVTADEMAMPLSAQPTERKERMKKYVSDQGVVAIGWSATEGYVRELFTELGQAKLLADRLAIVDINPHQPNHMEVCKSFKADPIAAGVIVKGVGPGTTDDLLLWIQTLRGCNAIRAACNNYPMLQAIVDAQASEMEGFDGAAFLGGSLVSVVDSWLPTWLRICFFSGAQSHRFTPGNELEVLPSEERDAHIPWAPLSDEREDLIAAASVLRAACENAKNWDFELFPGGFWQPSSQQLVLPVPIWADPDRVSSTYMRPIVGQWRDCSRISKIQLLPLDSPARLVEKGEDRLQRIQLWKESLAACFRHPHLSVASNFGDLELSQIDVA